ncbi:prepilin peptidase [Enterobacter ludwigii]|jgi:prepilin signal peptidase PulO-like enzyme (type II secretory pathway)
MINSVFFAGSELAWLSLATAIGLAAGSFLNVVIWRLPQMLLTPDSKLNLCLPGSHCASCRHPLSWRENIPLVSWLWLRGRCRHCRQAISRRYPLVELLTALITLLLAWRYPPGITLLALWFFSWTLIALSFIDYDHQLLPDGLTQPLLWGGLLFHLLQAPEMLAASVMGAIAGYLFFCGMYWLSRAALKREALGFGDTKLLAALGAWGGWIALPELLLYASVAGIAAVLLARAVTGRTAGQPIPFGPFLAISGWLIVVKDII